MRIIKRNKSKVGLVKEMLEILGTRNRYLKAVKELSQHLAIPDLEEVVLKEAEGSVDDFIDIIANIYADKFDLSTLEVVVKFLTSKAGSAYIIIGTSSEERVTELALEWSKNVMQNATNKLQVEKGISARDYIPPIGSYNRN